MKTNRFTLLMMLLFSLALLGFTAGCDDDDDDPASPGNATGTLRVTMTDAPALYDSVVVDVEQVSVHREDGDNSGWFVVDDTPRMIDLLELSNGNEVVLAEDELEAGQYTQIRLLLGEDNYLVTGGTSFPLTVPSGQQSGLKLTHGFTIEEDELYAITLDFDASRSIHQTGNGVYMLRPTIRVVATEVSGAIAGTISPANIQTYIMAVAGEDTVTTWSNAETGYFMLTPMLNGVYTVSFDPASDAWLEAEINDVEVEAGETTDLGTVTLQPAP